MMTHDDYNELIDDSFLAQIMSELPHEKAPEGFTGRVMQQIVPAAEPVYTPEYRRQMFWGYVALVAAMLFVVLMVVLQIPFIKTEFAAVAERIQNLLNAPVDLLEGINKMVHYLKASTTVIVISLATGLLLLFERLIRSGLQHKYTSP